MTDHHRPGAGAARLPGRAPRAGPQGIEGPAGELCAAGVVLKLSAALYAAAGLDPARADDDLDLAGLATVCDMVPLRDENRRIARQGMAAVAATRKAGLRALMAVADLEPGGVDAQSAGFRLGPRINAAGRLQRADAALELMLTEDSERAGQIARELDGLNHDRREAEQRILHEAEALCAPSCTRPRWWWPVTIGTRASWASWPPGSWSASGGPPWSSRWTEHPAAAPAAASRRTTSTPASGRAGSTCRASAVTGWPPGWRSRRPVSATSGPRWRPTPARP